MTSMDILPHQNGDSLDSDFSIIPVPEPEEPVCNGQLNGVLDLSNIHSALMSMTPDVSIDTLQTHLADVVQENFSLKGAVEKSNRMIKEQMKQLSAIMAWHDDLTTSMSQQQLDLKESEEKIAQLKKENAELRNKQRNVVDCAVSTGDSLTPLSDEEVVDFEIVSRNEMKNVSEETRKFQENIRELTHIINNQDKRIKILSKDFDYRQLEEKFDAVEKSLKSKELELEEEKKAHSETKKMFSVVQTNYDRVTRLLQIQSKDEKDKKHEDEERELDTRMYLEKIDDATAKLLAAEDQLEEKEIELKSLSSQVELLKAETEQIPILNSQIEIYKNELEKVTLTQEAASVEFERLYQEMQNSASLCGSCGRQSSHVEGASSGRRRHRRPEVGKRGELYICDICSACCRNIQVYEKHYNHCLDKQIRDKML